MKCKRVLEFKYLFDEMIQIDHSPRERCEISAFIILDAATHAGTLPFQMSQPVDSVK